MSANNGEVIYPYHEWKIEENEFNPETNYRDETIFTLGNGYLGMRGNFEENYDWPANNSLRGVYINGFFEEEPIHYGEKAYGYPEHTQVMLNVTDSKIVKLYLGAEEFNMREGNLIDYQRTLDMKKGMLTREVTWESPAGKRVKVEIERLISFTNQHLAAINYQVTPLNFSGEITLVSALEGAVINQEQEGDPRVGSPLQGQTLQLLEKKQEAGFSALLQQTTNTELALVCGMKNKLQTENKFKLAADQSEQRVQTKYLIEAERNHELCLTKYITYYTSLDCSQDELLSRAEENLTEAQQQGFDYYLAQQEEYLNQFWQQADIKIKGDRALQQGVRFNAFHLLQSVGKDGQTNIAAKGLTGEGYEGHYFWDTETYILPFFLYNKPEISRKLLKYRYNTLDQARSRARTMAHEKGALYPWRTIGGEECSAYYPASTAQYHINADIIYALREYLEATEDMDFFLNYGAEMLFETARLWVDLGDYIPKKDNQFCINEVTGPDEYTALVNNNCYTNYMAQMHLEYAAEMGEKLRTEYNATYQELAEKIGLQREEIEAWCRAAENMYLPYDEELGIHPQDDSFLEKEVWDFENTPEEDYPLLLNYHPLVIYRYQVCKQADTVLALFLLGDRFSREEKRRDFDYYERITTHDSSLSSCIYSILAAELGYRDKAYEYFMETARMDLDNYHNNTQHGVHTAAMAGAWMCLVNGFGGMRVYDGELSFEPYLPEKWDEYEFKVNFQGRKLQVTVQPDAVTYKLLSGAELSFEHYQSTISLAPGEQITKALT